MNKVNLTIDGINIAVPEDYTILEAAREVNIDIPTLCYLKDVSQIGSCRLCLVEVKGARGFLASCVAPVTDGMEIKTNTAKLRESRRVNLELILSNHNRECTSCIRSSNCELQTLCTELGVKEYPYDGAISDCRYDDVGVSVVRDNSKCILCRRCVAACNAIQNVGAIGMSKRGFDTTVGCIYDIDLKDSPCVDCGQCILVCPVGALQEKENIDVVWSALNDPTKHVVVQTAPAVRATLGEEFGLPIGTRVTGKMVSALKRLGFDKVFDTDFGADLTIMEEGTELIDRLTNDGVLPMITSCSPGWVKYCETFYPEFIPNLSSCKSPHEMVGALTKSYYAEKAGISPENIFTVSIMPCTAKKFEAQREELSNNGLQDVDVVLTVRELATMIKSAGIGFTKLPDADFDKMLGESTGASVIFGTTGGVMEAAIRTVYEIVTGDPLEELDLHDLRGFKGIRECEVDMNGRIVRVAVAHGTGNASKLLDLIKSGKRQYDFIEIMGCPGGCITGGGTPIIDSRTRSYIDPRIERAKAIYSEDESKVKRKSHENTEIQKLYENFLGEIGGEKAHNLLHTHYRKRSKY